MHQAQYSNFTATTTTAQPITTLPTSNPFQITLSPISTIVPLSPITSAHTTETPTNTPSDLPISIHKHFPNGDASCNCDCNFRLCQLTSTMQIIFLIGLDCYFQTQWLVMPFYILSHLYAYNLLGHNQDDVIYNPDHDWTEISTEISNTAPRIRIILFTKSNQYTIGILPQQVSHSDMQLVGAYSFNFIYSNHHTHAYKPSNSVFNNIETHTITDRWTDTDNKNIISCKHC